MRRLWPVLFVLVACGEGPPVPPDAGADAGFVLDAGFDAGTGSDAGSGDSGVPDAGAPDAGPKLSTIRVHYPAGTKSLSLRGSTGPFNWNTGQSMSLGANDVWTVSFVALSGPLEFKPLLDDTTWSRGPNYVVAAGESVDVYPHFFTTQGQFSARWPSFSSALLGNSRAVWVYLPPTYLENARARFPVVYMHDGQNLFDPAKAFGGNPWWVQNAINAAAENGAFAEAIVVGPEATGDRIGEYTPTASPSYPGSGKGPTYVRMLIEELKPKVDAELRTLPDRAHTVVLGSSLGGLISAYAGATRADTFGLVGAMSPSSWWDGRAILGLVGQTPASPRPLRVYVDSGDSGPSSDGRADTADLAQAYRTLGYSDGTTLKYLVQSGATHSEVYWAQRLPKALEFLLGPRQ